MTTSGPRAPALRRAGGLAALYVAAGYLAAIPYFVFFVDYPSVTAPADKVALLVDHQTSLYVMHLVSFQLVAVALVVVTLAVHQQLAEDAPAASQVAAALGVVRAGLLLASVMVFDHGMAVVVDQHASDPQQATATWQVVEAIADALGGAGGDILAGVWFLLVSGLALRASTFARGLGWLGLVTGAAALVSAVPGLGFFEVAGGLLQIVWFLWFGIVTVWTGPTAASRSRRDWSAWRATSSGGRRSSRS